MSTYVWEQSTYSTDAHGDPVLIIYGRDTTTRKIKSFGVKGFKPYFFAESEEGDVVSCFNTPLKKVVCKHPQEIVKQRALYGKTFDADIPYDMRWFIDNKVYYAFDDDLKPVDIPVFLPKICYYDIEINIDETSRPDPLNPEWAIVAISVFDSYKKKIRCFTLCDHKVHKNQICFTSEKELLEAWAKYVHTNDFDVLAGWYNKGFDQPYIINRAIKIGANMSALSRVRNDKVGGDRIAGRVVADMLELFKEWSKPLGQQSSYDLKSISKNPLFGGLEYQDYGEHIRELIESDNWKTLVQYSINDVISLQRIDEKCGLFSYFEGIRRLTGIKLDDCLMKTRIIEYFLMRETGYPLPTRTRHDKEDFKGAMVVKPDVGIRRWVGAYDLSALYPSIIVAYNVSPDAFNIIPRTIVKMMEEREKLRARRLKGEGGEILATTEQSLKYVINSFYGVMGYPSFKLFSQECAKLIPEKGREINMHIHDFLEKKGFKVEYGDSVAGDTIVPIYGQGNATIESLFKQIDYITPDGKEYYTPQNLYTDTIDAQGNLVVSKINKVMRHKVSKQMYRVWLTNEWYIDVTEDHSLIGWANSSHCLTRNIADRLIPVTPTTIGSDINSVVVRRKSLRDNVTSMNYPMQVYELLGLFLGDGSVLYGNKKYTYTFDLACGKDVSDIEKFVLNPLKEMGYLTTWNVSAKGDIKFNKCLMSSIIHTYAVNSEWKVIPEFMYYETDDAIAAYMRGAFTADGGILKSHGVLKNIRFCQTKKWVCDELQSLLYMIGISSNIYKGNTKNSYNGVCSGTNSYYLYISDMRDFHERVNFILPHKQINCVRNGMSPDLYDADFTIHRIKCIEPLPKSDIYVYDLEIENTHMFFANNILVHNTDSSYISTIDNPELGIKIEGEINDYLRNWSIEMGIKPELSPHIKLEKIYRNLFFKKSKTREGAAKKKYAGNVVWKDGHDIPDSASLDKRLDIKGFEIKRSDNSAITKEAMNDFFTKLLILDDEKGAVDGLKSIYFEVRRGQRSMLECAIPRDVKSDKKSPHKRGMVNSEMLLGVPWTGHSKPMLLYCAVPSCELCINEYNVTKVDLSYIKIDWPLQAEKTIRDKMETILESLGYKWETTIANQLTLADFM